LLTWGHFLIDSPPQPTHQFVIVAVTLQVGLKILTATAETGMEIHVSQASDLFARGQTMRYLLSWCGCLSLLVSGGCAMCAHPYDCWYAAYGGLRQRTDMADGRVGSVFDPAPEVSYAPGKQQSPQPTPAEEPAPAIKPPDESGLPTPQAPTTGPTTPLPTTEQRFEEKLPELPEGTLELPEPGPEPEPGNLPIPQGDQSPGDSTLPPDLPGSGDRSAARHPLHDLFDDES
jgi:hypothetical protein